MFDSQLPEGFDVVLGTGTAIDPLNGPKKRRLRAATAAAAGATICTPSSATR
jgi:hypothetical protein